MPSRRCLLVFTKPARAGRVKTRLIGELSAEQTAALHEAFLDDLLERLDSVTDLEVRIWWALEDGEPPPPSKVPADRQQGSDLGERLLHGLRSAGREFDLVAAIGSDHPDLPLERLDEAFGALAEGAELVLGPASDGGYYLIGCRRGRLPDTLFDGVVWSGPEVLSRTVRNAQGAGFVARTVALGHDVDTPADLERLKLRLSENPGLCPRTRRLLVDWGQLAPQEVEA